MKRRFRIDIWDNLRPVIQNEAARTGLSPNQIVNVILAEVFGLVPEIKTRSKN